MAKKEFLFHGKTMQEVQDMGIKEFSTLVPSNIRRKINRGFTDQEKILLEKVRKGKNNIKTHCRTMIVLPEMVGKTIKIHTGKVFEAITITEEMLGHYLGEYALSRKRVGHSAPGVGATRSSSSVSVR